MPREDIPIIEPYNPLDKRNLGASVAASALAKSGSFLVSSAWKRTFSSMRTSPSFRYAIYYRGDFAPYKRLVDLNKEGYNVPIYVGKAVPAGARKGGLGMNVDHGLALFNRLSEHFGSVSKANNLNEKDFMCRYLVVDDIWIPLAESMLIERFKPLWNRCIDGFGNHDPGKGRYQQQKSPWDCIHEGREWAEKLNPNTTSKDELLEKVAKYLENYTVQF